LGLDELQVFVPLSIQIEFENGQDGQDIAQEKGYLASFPYIV
jgi:hypothetical protein